MAGSLAAQQADIWLNNSTIESGEPAIVSVVLRNNTDSVQRMPLGRYEVDWTVRSQDGVDVAHWEPSGDVASLVAMMPAHSTKTFAIVALGTARIQQAGRYEIVAHYRPLDVSMTLPLTVVPSTAITLGKRAQELHDNAIITPGEEGRTAAEALASMVYAVPTPLFCDVMVHNPSATYAVLPRLEAAADRDALDCLIRALSAEPLHRPEIYPALQRLATSEKDAGLRDDIEQALAQQQ